MVVKEERGVERAKASGGRSGLTPPPLLPHHRPPTGQIQNRPFGVMKCGDRRGALAQFGFPIQRTWSERVHDRRLMRKLSGEAGHARGGPQLR